MVSASNSGASTPKSKLDTLSREDLVRFVKKQLENLGKARKEIASLKDGRELLESELKESLEAKEASSESLQKERCEERELKDKELAQLKSEIETLRANECHMEPQTDIDEPCDVETLKKEHEAALEALKNELALERGKWREAEEEEREVSDNLAAELGQIKQMLHMQTETLQKKDEENKILSAEVDELRSKLEDVEEKLVSIKEKQSAVSVLSLEMADYERSIDNLKKELKEANVILEQRDVQIKELNEKLKQTENEKDKMSATATKMKAVIVKLKKQSEERKESSERLEKDLTSVEQRHEQTRIEWEQERVRLSRTLGEQGEKIRQSEQTVSNMQMQIATLRSHREALQRQYDDITMEYESFKSKARYVLEQQKTTTQTDTVSDSDYKQLKVQMESEVQSNSTLSERCSSLERELSELFSYVESLKRETDEKLSRSEEQHKQLMTGAEARVSSLLNQNRHLKLEVDDKVSLLREKEREIRDLRHEVSLSQQESKRALGELGAERRRREEVESRAAQQIINTPPKPAVNRSNPQSDVELARRVNRELLQKPVVSRFDDAFNDENMLTTEVDDRPLEDVIFGEESEPTYVVPRLTSSQSSSFTHVVDADQLQTQLSHTAELLKETEENNALLAEQIKVLKEEVRRLERNADRAEHVANTEYLKNVIMKFLSPEKVNDERPQLIPVLTTMLRLNETEVEALEKSSRSDETEAQDASSSLLGGYLHRWTGFS
ncbi:hypothetical protein QR680_017548 [Steinernema hermaphroditum]|uniref:GRIP domain-containing protein n=1 Tax=Steinernema hermaphroditum TaxID=289476 RepID=A0AA39HEZ5_9BILA|nr:hypothetical protein QR680_017548 [Steinernema hermaphroditum]